MVTPAYRTYDLTGIGGGQTTGHFDPKEGSLVLTWLDQGGRKSSVTLRIVSKHDSKLFENNDSEQQIVRLSRPH